MSILRFMFLNAIVLLALPVCASAQEIKRIVAAPTASLETADQIIYKGLVGNVLDKLPLEPAQRVSLQRTNAVVSNTYLGRSLGALTGLGGPLLMIGGLVWGVWAASNINPETAVTQSAPLQDDAEVAATTALATISGITPGEKSRDDAPGPGIVSVAMTAKVAAPETARPRVIKVWLPAVTPE